MAAITASPGNPLSCAAAPVDDGLLPVVAELEPPAVTTVFGPDTVTELDALPIPLVEPDARVPLLLPLLLAPLLVPNALNEAEPRLAADNAAPVKLPLTPEVLLLPRLLTILPDIVVAVGTPLGSFSTPPVTRT